MRRSLTPLVASACAGLAAWCSMGSLAVAAAESGVVRFGLLPPSWLLPVLVLACVAIARAVRLSAPTSLPLLFSLMLVLPWLPIPVPPVFLMWSGHVAVAVWAAVVGGMLAAHGVRWPSWMSDARRAPRAAAAVACLLYLVAGWRLQGLVPGGDEPHYLVITQSLLKDGDLRIENNHVAGDYLQYFRGGLRPDYLRRGSNGQIYSIHAPGLSVVVAPAFAMFGYPGVVIFLSIVAAMGSMLLWQSAYLLTGSSGAAWFGWAVGALTVPFLFQTFAIYPDGLAATLVLFASRPLLDAHPGQWSKARWLGIGAVLALLPWLHTRFAVIAAVLGVVLILRLIGSTEGRTRLAPFLSIPVVGALSWLGFFRIIYGTFDPSAPYGGATQSVPVNILNGFPALLLDQQFGILPYAPVYGVCVIGMIMLARSRPRLALEWSAIAMGYLLATSMFYMWWAGTVSPARLAVPVLPLLALPGAWLWKSARRGSTRAIAVALLAISVAITAALVSVEGGRLAYNFRDGYSLAAERFSSIVDLPQGLPTFFRQTTAGAVLRATIWLLAVSGAWIALRIVERRSSKPGPALALATPACLAAAIMLALSIVWSIDRVSAATPETSQLTLLEHYDPRVRPLGVTTDPFRLESADGVLSRLSISTPTRRPGPARTLLLAPGIVPAGQYELRMKNPSPASGMARLVIGRIARPVIAWSLASDFRDGSVEFALPVDVGSLVVEGDDEAIRTSGGLVLRPRQVLSGSARLTDGYARRVERYGSTLAYFFDDGAFPEVPGFWIRGGAGSAIAVMPAERGDPIQLFVRNAPVANRVIVEVDGQAQVIDLQPREERTLPLRPAGDRLAALIRFQSNAGFRPSEVEPGSTDTRFLGVWIELR
ncbi:MAG: hypothetical protein EXQ55_01305 [Acidobacteria bacterium]|nr:hypothetical protein [Acidobacteriota bacterium]